MIFGHENKKSFFENYFRSNVFGSLLEKVVALNLVNTLKWRTVKSVFPSWVISNFLFIILLVKKSNNLVRIFVGIRWGLRRILTSFFIISTFEIHMPREPHWLSQENPLNILSLCRGNKTRKTNTPHRYPSSRFGYFVLKR